MKVLLILPAGENALVTRDRPRVSKRAMLRFSVLLLTIVAALAVLIWLPRIPQDLAYHNFADQRSCLGMPNAMDVASNLPLVGDRRGGVGIVPSNPADRVVRDESDAVLHSRADGVWFGLLPLAADE